MSHVLAIYHCGHDAAKGPGPLSLHCPNLWVNVHLLRPEGCSVRLTISSFLVHLSQVKAPATRASPRAGRKSPETQEQVDFVRNFIANKL